MLLDEMMAGQNVQEVRDTTDLILKLRGLGKTLVLVEHVMEGIMPIADRMIVLDYGVKIAEGRPPMSFKTIRSSGLFWNQIC